MRKLRNHRISAPRASWPTQAKTWTRPPKYRVLQFASARPYAHLAVLWGRERSPAVKCSPGFLGLCSITLNRQQAWFTPGGKVTLARSLSGFQRSWWFSALHAVIPVSGRLQGWPSEQSRSDENYPIWLWNESTFALVPGFLLTYFFAPKQCRANTLIMFFFCVCVWLIRKWKWMFISKYTYCIEWGAGMMITQFVKWESETSIYE